MKKFIVILLVCICIVFLFLFNSFKENTSSHAQDSFQNENIRIAIWKDANFEKLVRIYLEKPDGDIRLKELEDITELRIISNSSIETNFKKVETHESDIQNLGLITSMADIDNFINLKKLEISSNYIESIENVKIAPNITELNLMFNKLNDSNISELKNYAAIESLNLSSNYLEDISILKELKFVRELDLGYTGKVVDNVFRCEQGKIDFSVIKELPLLEELCIPFSIIENIDQLSSLPHLKNLILAQCSLVEGELLKIKSIQGLEEIDLYSASIDEEYTTPIDLAIFSNMKNLKKISIHDNIHNIEALREDIEVKIYPKQDSMKAANHCRFHTG